MCQESAYWDYEQNYILPNVTRKDTTDSPDVWQDPYTGEVLISPRIQELLRREFSDNSPDDLSENVLPHPPPSD